MTRTVTTSHALHARPASLLAKTAATFASQLTITVEDGAADAKSVLALMALDVQAGDRVTVSAEGPDADAALSALAHDLTAGEAHDG
ncbi:MAG TPA: HPr family phosphocarrier protein [Conexibacter sp.]